MNGVTGCLTGICNVRRPACYRKVHVVLRVGPITAQQGAVIGPYGWWLTAGCTPCHTKHVR
jgi:hypothetical protein